MCCFLGQDHFACSGNKLNLDRSRKVMVHSFTFREFGQAAMSDPAAWLTHFVVRANALSKVCGCDNPMSVCVRESLASPLAFVHLPV